MDRPYYPSKAAWATARASELRREARLFPTVPTADWRRVRRRMDAVRAYNAEADRFERMAARFRAEGR